jgi:hypothetical protein
MRSSAFVLVTGSLLLAAVQPDVNGRKINFISLDDAASERINSFVSSVSS